MLVTRFGENTRQLVGLCSFGAGLTDGACCLSLWLKQCCVGQTCIEPVELSIQSFVRTLSSHDLETARPAKALVLRPHLSKSSKGITYLLRSHGSPIKIVSASKCPSLFPTWSTKFIYHHEDVSRLLSKYRSENGFLIVFWSRVVWYGRFRGASCLCYQSPWWCR
jgi:hypothetical protein